MGMSRPQVNHNSKGTVTKDNMTGPGLKGTASDEWLAQENNGHDAYSNNHSDGLQKGKYHDATDSGSVTTLVGKIPEREKYLGFKTQFRCHVPHLHSLQLHLSHCHTISLHLSQYTPVTSAFLMADPMHRAQTFFFNELILPVPIIGITSILFVLQARCLSFRNELVVNWDCALLSLGSSKAWLLTCCFECQLNRMPRIICP